MSAGQRRDTIWVNSTNAHSRLHAYVWWPDEDNEPKGIVQLVHGMAEHIGRYEEFARYLAGQGFLVCGHDHVGHGKSVASHDEWGRWSAKDGKEVLINDVHAVRTQLCALVKEEKNLEHLPYFIFGHSMGSIVLRAYLARYAYGLAGAIMCGTSFLPPQTSLAGALAARVLVRLHGEDYRSSFLDSLGVGSYGQDIPDARTPLDWLSYNKENVDAYMADEACGFMFSAGSYAVLLSMLHEVCLPQTAERYPQELSLLYVAGTDDPVGENGVGVSRAADLAHHAGVKDVRCRLYAGMRHEILNEKGKQLVYGDLLGWMEDRLS